MTNYITAESFGANIPDNWEEIADAINEKLEAAGIPEEGDLTREQRDLLETIWENEIVNTHTMYLAQADFTDSKATIDTIIITDDLVEARKALREYLERLTARELEKCGGAWIEGYTVPQCVNEELIIGYYGDMQPDYNEQMSLDLRTGVQGFGIEKYGIEWGYEIDETGKRQIYVVDDGGYHGYEDTEEEADSVCRRVIEEFATNFRKTETSLGTLYWEHSSRDLKFSIVDENGDAITEDDPEAVALVESLIENPATAWEPLTADDFVEMRDAE